MTESVYREALDKVIRSAHESHNFITEERYASFMQGTGMTAREDKLTREYLDGIGIKFGEDDPALYEEPQFSEADGKYLDVYLKELEALPLYTEEEIIKAKVRAVFDDDEEAQAVLLNHYLKDVVDIAKLYIYQSLPAEDLIGEGNIGLMTAIKALATLESVDEVEPFVGKLIMDAMDKAIYEDTDIRRQAEELADRVNDIDEKAKKFSDEMKRPVTAMELAEETGMPLEEIIEAMRLTGDQIEGLVPIKQEGS